MSVELNELTVATKKLKEMSYGEIKKEFENKFGSYELWKGHKEFTFETGHGHQASDYQGEMTAESAAAYYNNYSHQIPQQNIISLQTTISQKEADLYNSPQAAYFYILSLIAGTETKINIKENWNYDLESQDGGVIQMPNSKVTSVNDTIGKKSDFQKAITLRNKVVEELVKADRASEAEEFKNQVNDDIVKKINSQIQEIQENLQNPDESKVKKANEFLEEVQNIQKTDPDIVSKFPEVEVLKESLKKNIEKLSQVKKVNETNVKEKTDTMPSQIKINEHVKTHINNVIEKTDKFYKDIKAQYTKFEDERQKFLKGKMNKEEYKIEKGKIEKKVGEISENIANLNALNKLSNPLTEEETQRLTNLSKNLEDLSKEISLKEKCVKAKTQVSNKFNDLFNEVVELDDMGIRGRIKSPLEGLKEAKSVENIKAYANIISQEFRLPPPDKKHEYAHLQSLVQEYAAIRALEVAPDQSHTEKLSVWKGKNSYEKKAPQEILDHHAGKEKNFWQKVGDFVHKVGAKIDQWCNPAHAENIKNFEKQREARHSGSLTLKSPSETPTLTKR